MRLGGFWGITAPMLVIATKKNGIDKIKPMIKALSENRTVINDLKSELVYLYNTANKIPKKYFVADGFATIESFDQSIRFVNGKLFSDTVDIQDFYMSFTVGCIMQMLNKHSKSGSNFRLPVKKVNTTSDAVCLENRVNVINTIVELISNEDFYLSSVKRVYRKILKSLETETGGCDLDSLAKSFMLNAKIPNNFIVNKETLTFSQEEIQILEFFANSKSVIRELLKYLKVKEIVENRMFGRSFRDILKSNPRALYWNVQERFDIIKSKNNSSFLTSLLRELTSDIEKFKNSLDTEVISQKDISIAKSSLTNEIYIGMARNFSYAKKNFFVSLLHNGYVKASDLTEENFNLISSVYDLVNKLGILDLNEFFNLDYTRSEWENLIQRLNKVGICGINLFSVQLLSISIENMTFVSNRFVIKNDDEISAFKNVLADIEALVSTIKPIGFELV